MESFLNVQFKWRFREYQQRVLDNANSFLSDGKINIVAAPGSGKTILGLELIRRLGNPCIILSPTTTIRQQWGSRFAQAFLQNSEEVDKYCSYDLRNIQLLNCITYQALYSAVEKIATSSADEEIDYSNVELFALIRRYGIKTVCLDEAHHLQNEWQKALEKFLKGLEGVTIISLTATPPYDSTLTEWNRYVSTCGEIDDEIFVPELVKDGTLCPHQDYVIFNFPTQKEISNFSTHSNSVELALDEVANLDFVKNLCGNLPNLYKTNEELFYENYSGIVALMIFYQSLGYAPSQKLFHKLTSTKHFPKMELTYAQRAMELLVGSQLLEEEQRACIVGVLKKYGLYDKKSVNLSLTDKLKRSLVGSAGKLKSIEKIVSHEYCNLQKQLRMLILTDYIKKDAVQNIGKDFVFNNLSVVSIFETVRLQTELVGCLSGSLVILPQSVVQCLPSESVSKVENLPNTQHSVVTFRGNNRTKVEIVSKLFEEGKLQVLVGTQSLLGEGWDSPCINSLILASYVGSFMLSNQMRGRAIRSDKSNAQKTSNIWHLVTLEPDYLFEKGAIKRKMSKMQQDDSEIVSYDYETLCRRFDCFVGPNYSTQQVESGIERLSCITPPYTEHHVEEINNQMFARAADRDGLRDSWKNALAVSAHTVVESKVPQQCRVPAFVFLNVAGLTLFAVVICILANLISNVVRATLTENIKILYVIALLVVCVGLTFAVWKILKFVLVHSSPKRSIGSLAKAVLNALQEMDLVKTDAKLKVESDKVDLLVLLHLKNATIYEQNIFNLAVKELLSPIENPRYVIVKERKNGKFNYKYSFACPSVFGKNSRSQEIFARHLKGSMPNMRTVYVYSEAGRKTLLNCRKNSFLNQNDREIQKRQRVTKFE